MFKIINILKFIILYYIYVGIIYNIFPKNTNIIKLLTFICDLIIILYGLKVLQNYPIKFFKKGYLSIILISTVTFFINYKDTNIIYHLNGLREFLVFISWLVLFQSSIHLNEIIQNKKLIRKYIIIFLISQIIISIIQFKKYGANDHVGGSFGVGGSGILTFVIFYLVYILINMSYIKNNRKISLKIFLNCIFLFPVFINETKISVSLIVIFIMSFMLIKRNYIKIIILPIIGIVIIFIFNKYYIKNTIRRYSSVKEIYSEKYLDKYLISSNKNINDVPRLKKIKLSIILLKKNYLKLFFGLGYGIGRGGAIIAINPNNYYFKYLIRGSITLFQFLLLQGGIALTVLYIVYNFFYILKIPKEINYDNFHQKMFYTVTFIISWFYQPALCNNQGYITIVSFIIIYIININKY